MKPLYTENNEEMSKKLWKSSNLKVINPEQDLEQFQERKTFATSSSTVQYEMTRNVVKQQNVSVYHHVENRSIQN